MDKTLQIVELMLNVMEKNPGRYKVEIAAKGMCIIDYEDIMRSEAKMPAYYTHVYNPTEDYEVWCNKMFKEFIGGLKA